MGASRGPGRAAVVQQEQQGSLRAHIETTESLTAHQIALYGEPRGYGPADHSAHPH